MTAPYQVLFVDDSATMHRILHITFARENMQVTGAYNAAEATQLAKALLPRIMLIDIGLPDVDGYVLCATLKQDPSTASIMIVLMASATHPFDAQRAQTSGAAGYITKPFETHVLIDKINSYINAPAPPVLIHTAPAPAACVTPEPPPPVQQHADPITAATKEIIEKIAWEVVPTLAETIIKEHIERLIQAKNIST